MAASTKPRKLPAEGLVAPVFTKRNILTFKRYAKRRDLLSVLLKEGQEYTMDQVDRLIADFMKKGKVK